MYFQKVSWNVIGKWTLMVTIVVAAYFLSIYNDNQRIQRQSVVCPSFLSIARSARDTLIVMRNEPLCNRYVLDNLQ